MKGSGVRYRFGRSVLLVYLLATATSLHATSVARFTFDALCVQANTIAVVRCTESEAFREEATGRILTRTRLEVVRGVKGPRSFWTCRVVGLAKPERSSRASRSSIPVRRSWSF